MTHVSSPGALMAFGDARRLFFFKDINQLYEHI